MIKESPLEHTTPSSSVMQADKESAARARLQHFQLDLRGSHGEPAAEMPHDRSVLSGGRIDFNRLF